MKPLRFLCATGLCLTLSAHAVRSAEPLPSLRIVPSQPVSPQLPLVLTGSTPQPLSSGPDLVLKQEPARSPAPAPGPHELSQPRPLAAAPLPPGQPLPSAVAAGANRITLEEARQRTLANSNLLRLAALNVHGKAYATRAMQANYFPKVIGFSVYAHFDNPLGTVLTTQGRVPLVTPGTEVPVNVLKQDSSFTTFSAVQPLTDLLKVRQGVKIAQADEQIAQADVEKASRALVSGVDQLYWGLLAARRIQAGAQLAVRGAEALAATGAVEARIALVEGRQALLQVTSQIESLEAQLNSLLDLPPCTRLELIEPPFPVLSVSCAEEAAALAVAASPEVRSAEQDLVKARAAVAAAKVDYVPNLAVIGGYANQTGASYIQQNINYVSVVGSYTFVDWGQRRNTVRQRENMVALARTQLQKTQEEVRQKGLKAFRELAQSQQVLRDADEMVQLRKEAEKKATAPADLLAAARARGLAEVDLVKADLAYRTAHVELAALLGKQ